MYIVRCHGGGPLYYYSCNVKIFHAMFEIFLCFSFKAYLILRVCGVFFIFWMGYSCALLLQKMSCSETSCSAVLVDPCGHLTCRSHSFCSFEVEGALVWLPDDCHTCYAYWTTLFSDTVRDIFTMFSGLHCMFFALLILNYIAACLLMSLISSLSSSGL